MQTCICLPHLRPASASRICLPHLRPASASRICVPHLRPASASRICVPHLRLLIFPRLTLKARVSLCTLSFYVLLSLGFSLFLSLTLSLSSSLSPSKYLYIIIIMARARVPWISDFQHYRRFRRVFSLSPPFGFPRFVGSTCALLHVFIVSCIGLSPCICAWPSANVWTCIAL